MKYSIYIIVLLSLFLMSSCNKDETDILYHVNAKKNNKAWKAVSYNVYNKVNSDTLTLSARAIPEGTTLPEETLTIIFKSTGSGTYELVKNGTRFYTTLGLDMIVKDYKLSADNISKVTISNYNEKDKTIEGTFNLSFQNAQLDAPATDVVVLSNGSFLTKVTIH
jgi:hypothetical protein